ncbi:MAG: hypothetical protein K6B46_01610 [Opitutales bacterium]|nr:hypothetical protein [Opitutales bacterium]
MKFRSLLIIILFLTNVVSLGAEETISLFNAILKNDSCQIEALKNKKEFFKDIFNGRAHFVGSGRGDVTIQSQKNCTIVANFLITNTTSLRSLFYHLYPNKWNITQPGWMFLNWTQKYNREEEYHCKYNSRI